MGKLTCLPQGLRRTEGKRVQNLETPHLERNSTSLPSSRSMKGGREGFSPLQWPEEGEGQHSKGFSGSFGSGTDTFCPGNPRSSFSPGWGSFCGWNPQKVEFLNPLLQIVVSHVGAGPWRGLGRAEGFKEHFEDNKMSLEVPRGEPSIICSYWIWKVLQFSLTGVTGKLFQSLPAPGIPNFFGIGIYSRLGHQEIVWHLRELSNHWALGKETRIAPHPPPLLGHLWTCWSFHVWSHLDLDAVCAPQIPSPWKKLPVFIRSQPLPGDSFPGDSSNHPRSALPTLLTVITSQNLPSCLLPGLRQILSNPSHDSMVFH